MGLMSLTKVQRSLVVLRFSAFNLGNGDIDIVGRQGGLIRRWISGELESGRLEARQLPHPAFFVRRNVLAELGVPFDDSYRSSQIAV